MGDIAGRTRVDLKFAEVMMKYQQTFPPFGIPPEDSAIYYHRESLIFAYNIYCQYPSEFEGILIPLFDEFDAAEGLVQLGVFRG